VTDAEFLVEIKNARVYIRDTPALDGIDWTMLPDQNWAVLGNNGAGKTTFMKVVFGELLPVYGGTVYWFGKRERRPLRDVRTTIGYVSAEYQENYGKNITGKEVVISGLHASIGLYDAVVPQQERAALEWMDFLNIAHLAKKRFLRMSYGEARRVLLARALVNRPKLLILDEPCNGLDIPTKELFLATVEKLTATETRLIYVTHHIDEILPGITHVLCLKAGKVFRQGKKEEILRDDVLSEALGCRLTLQHRQDRYWLTSIEKITPA
jgi:ABC-type molybdenum transport system ATPase subunit/photorepair protein PhrA